MDDIPIVMVVRHPDAENAFTVHGDVRIISIDLGASFDASRLSSADADAVHEAVAGWRAEIADLPVDQPIRVQVESLCEELLAEVAPS